MTGMMTGQLRDARTGPGLSCAMLCCAPHLTPSPGGGFVISHPFSASSHLKMTSLVSS